MTAGEPDPSPGLCGGVAGWVGARMETANLRRWQDEARRVGGWS